MRFGAQELVIILLIVLLIFGARKLPELARSLGTSAKEFRKGIEEASADDEAANAVATNDESAEVNRPESAPPDSRNRSES